MSPSCSWVFWKIRFGILTPIEFPHFDSSRSSLTCLQQVLVRQPADPPIHRLLVQPDRRPLHDPGLRQRLRRTDHQNLEIDHVTVRLLCR